MSRRPAITAAMKLDVLRRCGVAVRCSECQLDGDLDDMQFDHHLALIDGGAHEVENLRPLCTDCHAAKSAREHKANCKAKRLARERAGEPKRKRVSRPLKSAGFRKDVTRSFDGKVRPREA